MEKNEIKKALYKQNPKAILKVKNETGELFTTTLLDNTIIEFFIPVNETFDADGKYIFDDIMDAKYLIRWIKN